MGCTTTHEEIGLYVDGELPPERAALLRAHLSGCTCCGERVARLGDLAIACRPGPSAPCAPPAELWERIECQLDLHRRRQWIHRLIHRPLAMAASAAVLLGAGVFMAFWLSHSTQVARADAVDYRILLDGIARDADAAIDRFLNHYEAHPISSEAMQAEKTPLHFRIPAELPGGYELRQGYRIRIGNTAGYAAKYRRENDGDVVFTCFHKPVNKTLLGIHRDSHCALAQGSHCVEVGPWQLIHFTDPSACH